MPDKLHAYRQAYLLLQLLGAEDRRLMKSAANKALSAGPNKRALDLGAAAANEIRAELSPECIRATRARTPKGGTALYYELTDEGLARLAAMEQYPADLLISGRALNRLLAATRAAAPSDKAPPPAARTLREAILGAFEELLRERYSHTRLVPIHALRAAIAAELGAQAARHEVLDPELKKLWRERRLRLIPISDLRQADESQLAEAVPGVNETLFYLEPER